MGISVITFSIFFLELLGVKTTVIIESLFWQVRNWIYCKETREISLEKQGQDLRRCFNYCIDNKIALDLSLFYFCKLENLCHRRQLFDYS